MYINPDAKELSNRRPVTVLSPVRAMLNRYNPNLIYNVLYDLGYAKHNMSKTGVKLIKKNLKAVLGTIPRHVLSNMVIALTTFETQRYGKLRSTPKTSS
jgi:hypothetical protein